MANHNLKIGMVCLGQKYAGFVFFTMPEERSPKKEWWVVRDSNAGPMD